MLRAFFVVSLMAMLACGADQSDPGTAGSDADTPPVSAVNSAADAIEVEEIEVEAIEIETAPQVSSCLGLVTSGAFAQAVPVCLEAAAIDPENAEVQAALAKAQAQAALDGAASTASAAAESQAADATDAASGAAADALGGLGD
jgi:hypothetical protein